MRACMVVFERDISSQDVSCIFLIGVGHGKCDKALSNMESVTRLAVTWKV